MKNPAILYAEKAALGQINVPKYIKKQCKIFLTIVRGEDKQYIIDFERVVMIDKLLHLLTVPKGLRAGERVNEVLSGFQWLFIIAVLCVVHRDDKAKRRYERVILEICRKNGKTFLVAVIIILLFFTEPKYSKFYSVAPDGTLSREVKTAIEEILNTSEAMAGTFDGRRKFKILRDYVHCNITENRYIPLNYSTSRLDGRLPNVYLVDETGALPNSYAIEAMASGQLTIKNKLGLIISTKYPTHNNPFEDEVEYCKKVLDNVVDNDTVFSLLFEPDNKKDWAFDDGILEQSNPLAIEMPEMMNDLKLKRQMAIESESKRENFITKHCNIIYQGIETESYVNVDDLKKGKVNHIDWSGRDVYIGVDLAMSNDNCAVSLCSWDDECQCVLLHSVAFIPADKIEEKSRAEKINYKDFIRQGCCVACGGAVVDYAVIEDYVLTLDEMMGVNIKSIAYDRYNALSSAQKWERAGLTVIETKQHSSVLHAPTKFLSELIEQGKVIYTENKLLEINFGNARCRYDTNMNRYVNKKRSNGKIDMAVAAINAMYPLQQTVQVGAENWTIQI